MTKGIQPGARRDPELSIGLLPKNYRGGKFLHLNSDSVFPVFRGSPIANNLPRGEFPLPLRLLIADDNELLRMGVRTLIELKRDWEICGEASDGDEAIAKALALSPDVVVLDLSMPMLNGFRAAEEIRRASPSTKIVFLSVHDVPATASAAGADAFVSKASPAEVLISTIERVSKRPTAASGS